MQDIVYVSKGCLSINAQLTFAGWGTLNFGGPVSSVLQEAQVRVWSNTECSLNYGKLDRTIADSMLCASDPGKDACQVSRGPYNPCPC